MSTLFRVKTYKTTKIVQKNDAKQTIFNANGLNDLSSAGNKSRSAMKIF